MVAGSGYTRRRVGSFALNCSRICVKSEERYWSILIGIRWRTVNFHTERVRDRQFSRSAQGGSRVILRQTAWLAQDQGILAVLIALCRRAFVHSENTKRLTIIPEHPAYVNIPARADLASTWLAVSVSFDYYLFRIWSVLTVAFGFPNLTGNRFRLFATCGRQLCIICSLLAQDCIFAIWYVDFFKSQWPVGLFCSS